MLIITSCSSKKRIKANRSLDGNLSQAFDLYEFARNWVGAVRAVNDTYTPENMYAGVGFSAVQNAAVCLGANIQFLSAGMSLVDSNTRIPAYNLTISESGPTPFTKVDMPGTSADWWNALNKAFGYETPLYAAIKNHDGLVYIALPSGYLSMVNAELVKAVDEFPEKLRIITSNKNELEPALQKVAIRYDQRLNTMQNGPSGANASFTQRALLHFANLMKDQNAESHSVSLQQGLVNDAFKGIGEVAVVKRTKINEQQLLKHVQNLLSEQWIARTKLLAYLRHEVGVACEQSRFNKAYDQAMKLRT